MPQPNPHPLDYKRILAQIALDHPNGGADLHAEVARRFMADGGQAPEPDPVDLSADAMTQPVVQVPAPAPSGFNPDNAVAAPLGYVKALLTGGPDALAAKAENDLRGQSGQTMTVPGVNVARTPPPADVAARAAAPAPSKFPGVATPGTPPAPAPVQHGGAAPAQPQDDDISPIEHRANISDVASADVAQKQGAAEAAARQQIADQQQMRVQRDNELDQAVQENWMRLAKTHEDLINRYVNSGVDPNRYWNSLDTGHKILAGVAQFLGPLGGIVNMASGTMPLREAIQSDIANQQAQIERTGKASGMVGELMDKYSKMGLDHASATQMAATTATAIGEERAKQIAASFGGDRAKAALGQAFMKNSQSAKTIQDTAMASTLKKAQASQAWSEAAKNKVQTGLLGSANAIRDLDGNEGMAPTPEVANAYNTAIQPSREIYQTVNDIENERANGTIWNKGTQDQYGKRLAASVLALQGMKDTPRAQEMADALAKKPGETFNFIPGQGWDKTKKAVLQLARDQDMIAKQDPRLRFKPTPPPIRRQPIAPRT